MTILEELTAVRAAIATVLSGGQSYMIDGVQFGRANLKELYAREAVLLRRLSRVRNRPYVTGMDMSTVMDA